MFVYEKKLQYPVRIQNVNPQLAAIVISQYGGPHDLGVAQSAKRIVRIVDGQLQE